MHKVNHSALLPFSDQQIFDLVDDIESYPQFLPYCTKTEELERDEAGVKASIFLKKGPFSYSFTTQNDNTPFTQIKMNLVEGPFKSFEGLWGFEALSNTACKVTLNMTFQIDNSLLNRAFAKFFDHVANAMMDAFSKRAREVYR